MKKKNKIILIAVLALFALILLQASFVIVPAGNAGVVLTLGKVNENSLSEGFHLKAPFVQKVEIVSNKIQKLEVQAAAVTKDLQSVTSDIAVNFRVSFVSSAQIVQNIGPDYQEIILLPAVQESMKGVSARYTAEELITMRAQVGQEIKETLENKVSEYGIIVEKFNIVNFSFSQEFDAAIEAKQVAEQNLIKTQTEQQQAIVIAEAQAKQKLIQAEAEAEAIMKTAQAQADANKLLAESLNETIIEYDKVQKWDGKLPQAWGGTPILDLRGDED